SARAESAARDASAPGARGRGPSRWVGGGARRERGAARAYPVEDCRIRAAHARVRGAGRRSDRTRRASYIAGEPQALVRGPTPEARAELALGGAGARGLG